MDIVKQLSKLEGRVGDFMEMVLKRLIEDIKCSALELKGEVYIVGGYVRDKLMDPKSKPRDVDFIYGGNILDIIKSLSLKGYCFYAVNEEEGIFSTNLQDCTVDISNMKGQFIEEDLGKRDYTVNAVALNLMDMKIIDPFKGRTAIKSRILQEVGENSLKDDPIRILRGMRFYIKYGFHFSIYTEEHVLEYGKMLKESKGERVLGELMSIIQNDVDGRAFELLDNYKILENIIPYIHKLKSIGKEDYKQLDVFSHMDLSYKTYKELLNGRINLDNFNTNMLKNAIGNYTLSEYLSFANFVHDIGKAIHIENHYGEGGNIIEGLCQELKFPKEGLKIVVSIVKNHGIPYKLFKERNELHIKENIYGFFIENQKYVPYILIGSFCDIYAARIIYDGENEKDFFKAFIESLFHLFDEYNRIVGNKWISGDFILENTIRTGKDIGIILEEVNKLVFIGKINNKEEAKGYIISKYGGK